MEAFINLETMLKNFAMIRKVYAKEFARMLGEENLSPNEINILMVLSNNPSINTSKGLVFCLDVSKGLVCRSIDTLVKRQLLVTRQDERDGRIQRLELSETAAPVIAKIRQVRSEIDAMIFADISEEEILQMEHTLEKILSRFSERLRGEEEDEDNNVKGS